MKWKAKLYISERAATTSGLIPHISWSYAFQMFKNRAVSMNQQFPVFQETVRKIFMHSKY
jgi:hypothetical protein